MVFSDTIHDITSGSSISTFLLGFFFFKSRLNGDFFLIFWGYFDMDLKLIRNPDASKKLLYQIARIVYAETSASSLAAVEAMTSMIQNKSQLTGQHICSIINNPDLFNSLDASSARHSLLNVLPTCRGFQMCLRVAGRMIMGTLPDMCRGATCFHHSDVMPDWARSRGYILDIDDLLFYL